MTGYSGKFITLEGGEGSGKSTQAKCLVEYLRGQGRDVVLTREVGGSPSAEDIRSLWLGKGDGHWDGLTEALLISAARREHLTKTVWPELERGAWVVSDRFVDSTRAYQGVGLGLGVDLVDRLYRDVAGEFEPDFTLLLDVPIEISLSRMAGRGGQDDRYQQKEPAFHQKLRDAYLGLAAKYPARIKVVDASGDENSVTASIRLCVNEKFTLSQK